jgi:2'-5' RNA ligase
MSARLFTAIRIPQALHDRLAALQAGVPGARWVAPENFHITLGFLGDVEESRFEDLHDILNAVAGSASRGFSLTLDGTGAFGRKAPKLLWAGVQPCSALEQLQSKLTGRLARTGFLTEKRKFRPHVTLAYLAGGRARGEAGQEINADPWNTGPWFEITGAFLGTPFEVTHFTLVESHLGNTGGRYSDLETYSLV